MPWSVQDFEPIAAVLRARHGESLPVQRATLVRARLQAQLQTRGIPSFTWFYDRVLRQSPRGLGMQMLIDLSTVNHSSFFREPATLGFIAERLAERLALGPVRAWSAGSAAGQEPYSLAMLVSELAPGLVPGRLEIWASDLSLEMVRVGAAGIYDEKEVESVSEERLRRFFLRGRGPREGAVRIAPEIRRLITWQHFDLRAAEWPIPGDFDTILCRNVTLYVPENERVPLIERMAGRLNEGGFMVLGNCEILPSAPRGLEKIAPSIYRKTRTP